MAPIATTQNGNGVTHDALKTQNGHANTNNVKLPLTPNGSLDNYERNDLTPCIGREFPTANLVDMMQAPNSDELLTELALTSMGEVCGCSLYLADSMQFPSVAWSGSASKTASRTIYKRS